MRLDILTGYSQHRVDGSYLNFGLRDLLDLHRRSWRLGSRGGSRLRRQGPGRGDVVSIADFGLLFPRRWGGAVGLLAEQRWSEINGNDGEEDGGDDDGRVQIHDGEVVVEKSECFQDGGCSGCDHTRSELLRISPRDTIWPQQLTAHARARAHTDTSTRTRTRCKSN